MTYHSSELDVYFASSTGKNRRHPEGGDDTVIPLGVEERHEIWAAG